MKRFALLCLVAGVVLAGCKPKEPPKPVNAPPPPPTAEQINSEMMAHINPLMKYMAADADVPANEASEAINKLRNSKTNHQLTINGPEGIRRVTTQVDGTLNRAYNERAWALCLVMGEALKVLDPANEAYTRKLEEALIQKNKPKIEISSFISDKATETTVVFMDIYLPETGQFVKKQAREGEEFYNCKIIEMIGKNEGIRVEYLLTHDLFDVYLPGKAPAPLPGQAPAPSVAPPAPAPAPAAPALQAPERKKREKE
jgi:hypothetical protein